MRIYLVDDNDGFRESTAWLLETAGFEPLAYASGADFLAEPKRSFREPVTLIVLAAALTIAFADLSGLSKAEVERIWLPFEVWLLPAVALLPSKGRRWWLAASAATALVVNHLVLTSW